MLWNLRTILRHQRPLHTLSSDKLPSEMLRKKIAELENFRRKKKSSKRDEFIVNVPGNTEFLDTPTMPMILIAVGIAIFAKLLMIHDDATAQERLERKMKKLPPGTGTVRMLSKEEWEAIQDIGPQTPYESKYARPNARLRTGDPMHMEDVKDWTIDVLRDGLSRIEECATKSNHDSRTVLKEHILPCGCWLWV
ncbi:hypothetical protein MRB53_023154 [Persea americana]|uniref:Uncharacterized protein n=1 Tax=Persea americana TaxID=3435 RepID=A0ACC2L8L0_PERAE|nr:hypothetical protein MRB53_023154 [Persea americana]